MDTLLTGLESLSIIEAIRFSRWGYALVNAGHVLGVAMLVGAVIPLNLKLLGFWSDVSRQAVSRIMSTCAAIGLALAIPMGVLLFATRANHYAGNEAFLFKMVLVSIGTLAALRAHWLYGWRLTDAPVGPLRGHAVVSLICWIGALFSGRLIAFL